jgi:PAS domain S-box-containing protein
MTSPFHLSLRRKLIGLILLSSVLALLCVTLAAVFFETTTFRPRVVESLNAEAGVLEEVLSASLDFELKDAARRGLNRHCSDRNIVLAALYNTESLFAVYQRTNTAVNPPPFPEASGHVFTAQQLALWRPVRNHEGDLIGHLYLLQDLPPLRARLTQYSIMAGAVLLALAVVGGVLMSGVRQYFLRPLAALVDTAVRVTRHNDYGVRAPVHRDDELGQLAAAFNRMLSVVGQRDAALREASTRIQNVFNSATEVIIVATNPKGLITVFNAGAERILGYRADEVVGRQTVEMFHLGSEIEERAAALSGRLGRKIEGFETLVALTRSDQPEARECTFVRKDGTQLKVHLVVTVMQDEQGGITGYLGVASDITELKRKEEELQRKNAELERFTYTVSHDLKSPLITIKGFTGALTQDVAAGRHQRLEGDLKRIAAATDKMADLLNDLLELSRVGRIVNPPVDVPLGDLVREVLELLDGPVRESGVAVAVQPDLPSMHCDRQRLSEVYQNLVENAIRYMGGQPEPRIEIGMRNQDGSRVFFVRDNGLGIEPRYHETVFGLFNKLDAKTPGTGIGLALARRIIEVHGGKIWVESEGLKKGSTFCFTLPSTPPSRKEKQA